MSMCKLNSHTILQLWCCCHVMYKLLYPSIRVRTVYGHFGTKTLWHRWRSVRRTFRHWCRSVLDISAPITEVVMLVNGGSYVVDGEGSLKQSTFMCISELWVLKSAQWCDGVIATSVENASCDYYNCYGVNVQGPLSFRLHRCAFTICRFRTQLIIVCRPTCTGKLCKQDKFGLQQMYVSWRL